MNIYQKLDPHIIVINSHGLTNEQPLKIFNYIIHQKNFDDSPHNGTAIAIRKDIACKIEEDFETDLIAATIDIFCKHLHHSNSTSLLIQENSKP